MLWSAGVKPATGWPVIIFNHGHIPLFGARISPVPKRRSWSFDAQTFNPWLVGEIVEDDRIRLDRYRNLTQRIVDTASGVGRQYLEALVVDEEDFADDGSI